MGRFCSKLEGWQISPVRFAAWRPGGGGQHGYWVGWAALIHHGRRSARARDSPCVLGSNPCLVTRSWFVSLDKELALCPRGYPFQHFPVLKEYSATSGSFSPRLRGFVAFGAHNLSNKDGPHFGCFATTGTSLGIPACGLAILLSSAV